MTDVLRAQNVRPRGMVSQPGQAVPPPLKFRELTLAYGEECLDWLRREGRTEL